MDIDEPPRVSTQATRVHATQEQVPAASRSFGATAARAGDAAPRVQRVSSIPPSSVRIPRPGSASQQRYDDVPEIQVHEAAANSPDLDAAQAPVPQPRASRPPSGPSTAAAPVPRPSKPPELPLPSFKVDK